MSKIICYFVQYFVNFKCVVSRKKPYSHMPICFAIVATVNSMTSRNDISACIRAVVIQRHKMILSKCLSIFGNATAVRATIIPPFQAITPIIRCKITRKFPFLCLVFVFISAYFVGISLSPRGGFVPIIFAIFSLAFLGRFGVLNLPLIFVLTYFATIFFVVPITRFFALVPVLHVTVFGELTVFLWIARNLLFFVNTTANQTARSKSVLSVITKKFSGSGKFLIATSASPFVFWAYWFASGFSTASSRAVGLIRAILRLKLLSASNANVQWARWTTTRTATLFRTVNSSRSRLNNELFAANWTYAKKWHSEFTSRCLPEVLSADGGKNRFSGISLADTRYRTAFSPFPQSFPPSRAYAGAMI